MLSIGTKPSQEEWFQASLSLQTASQHRAAVVAVTGCWDVRCDVPGEVVPNCCRCASDYWSVSEATNLSRFRWFSGRHACNQLPGRTFWIVRCYVQSDFWNALVWGATQRVSLCSDCQHIITRASYRNRLRPRKQKEIRGVSGKLRRTRTRFVGLSPATLLAEFSPLRQTILVDWPTATRRFLSFTKSRRLFSTPRHVVIRQATADPAAGPPEHCIQAPSSASANSS